MIDIIKKGERFRYKTTCPNCGCVYTFEHSDLLISDAYDCSAREYTTVCPCCAERVDMRSSQLIAKKINLYDTGRV